MSNLIQDKQKEVNKQKKKNNKRHLVYPIYLQFNFLTPIALHGWGEQKLDYNFTGQAGQSS